MKKLLYIYILTLLVSCDRRDLTYDYNPTAAIKVVVDWANMSATPSGMSIYCYPTSGEEATVLISNDVDEAIVDLGAGTYNILIFNLTPAELPDVDFELNDGFENAKVYASSTVSEWAVAKSDDEGLVKSPKEIAAATYMSITVTQEAVEEAIALRSRGVTKSEDLICETIYVEPKVVVRNTRVRVWLTNFFSHSSTRATIYGMASGYHFFTQKSHTDMATHILSSDSWVSYTEDYNNGYVYTYFLSFGLPDQTTSTRTSTRGEWDDWDGMLYIDFLMTDNTTIQSEEIELWDKVVVNDTSSKADSDSSAEVSVDIDVDTGSDSRIVLPDDITPSQGSTNGFDAVVDEWGDEVGVDLPL